MKPKILCICLVGLNRSRYLASYLKNKGYKTRYGGICRRIIDCYVINSINQKDVDWADIIIVTRKKFKPRLKKRYKIKDKKIISLDVRDSKRYIIKKYPELKKLDFWALQKKWTYPQLRKAIKPYLPL